MLITMIVIDIFYDQEALEQRLVECLIFYTKEKKITWIETATDFVAFSNSFPSGVTLNKNNNTLTGTIMSEMAFQLFLTDEEKAELIENMDPIKSPGKQNLQLTLLMNEINSGNFLHFHSPLNPSLGQEKNEPT